MSLLVTEQDVVQCVLECFRGELRGLRGGWISRKLMGVAPTEGYACQWSDLDARGRMTGNELGAWRITHAEIIALAVPFTFPAPARVSGMYYDTANCEFVVAPDYKSVVVGSQVGPRFGQGVRYEVVTDDHGHTGLRMVEALWKS